SRSTRTGWCSNSTSTTRNSRDAGQAGALPHRATRAAYSPSSTSSRPARAAGRYSTTSESGRNRRSPGHGEGAPGRPLRSGALAGRRARLARKLRFDARLARLRVAVLDLLAAIEAEERLDQFEPCECERQRQQDPPPRPLSHRADL